MKIDLYAVMYNEEKILPYFFRHYDQYVSRYFIFDDQSTDKTREILAAHPNVMIFDMEKHGCQDKYWTENIYPQYEIYSRGHSDWVFCVDADEFIYHSRLLDDLERYKKRSTVKILFCTGFMMISDTFPTTDGQIYDEIKMGLRDRWADKSVIFSPDIHLRYKPGRHGLQDYPGEEVRKYKTSIRLLHYRFLGKDYFMQRDARVIERNNLADGGNKVYSPDMRRNLPDATMGPIFPWLEANKYLVEDCVNYG